MSGATVKLLTKSEVRRLIVPSVDASTGAVRHIAVCLHEDSNLRSKQRENRMERWIGICVCWIYIQYYMYYSFFLWGTNLTHLFQKLDSHFQMYFNFLKTHTHRKTSIPQEEMQYYLLSS